MTHQLHYIPAVVSRKRRPGQSGRSRAILALLVCCVAALAVALYFRHQIESGFTILNGDQYDQVIEVSILEHWYNVFRGLSPWNETGYFYPVTDTLGYNDGYFLFGCIYSIFRAIGIDPYLGAELVNVLLRVIGFFSFYLALRRIPAVGLFWALLGAVLFTLSDNMFVQAGHGQLLSIGLAPLVAVLLHKAIRALRDGRSYHLVIWGAAAAILYSAWLLTAFYMAWFFAFYAFFFTVAYVLIEHRSITRRWLHLINQQKVLLGLIALIFLVTSVPFLSVYLPKAHETGMHPYSDAMSYSPSLLDLWGVGRGNLLYGLLVASIDQTLRPGFPAFSERTSGFPPVLLFLFACGVAVLWRRRRSPAGQHDAVLFAFAIAAVFTWMLTVHVRSLSLWWYAYELFPGAKAIRTIARYQIFLSLPVIAVACFYLAQHSNRIPKPVLGLLSALLLLGEINTASTQNLDRHAQLARLAAVPSPPSECRAFFVSNPPPGNPPGPAYNLYGHNIQAMIIAAMKHLPTVNGWATFVPAGWALINPGSPNYLRAVRDFANSHHVEGLCGLDLTTIRWSTTPLIGID